VDGLRPARSGDVCITCQHFRNEVGRHCIKVLTFPIKVLTFPPRFFTQHIGNPALKA
jgi:hypothetical protein